jgi:hypothetical protein
MAELCAGVGTWNPVYERCVCPIGRSGTHCETLSLQSCRPHRASSVTVCTVQRPLHCECLKQCKASGAFLAHLPGYCFERPQDSANERPVLSDIPALSRQPSSSVTFRSWPSRQRVEAEKALSVLFKEHLRHVPHRFCPSRCSDHGACVANAAAARVHPVKHAFCRCDPYYKGSACEVPTHPTCYNNCSGRGACVDGFCACRPPHFGPGCAYGPDTPASPADRHFRVHVYDLEPIVLRRVTYGSDPDPIFNTHHTFVSALLGDPASLTPSPMAADLLLVPAFGTNMEALLEYYEHAQSHVASRFADAWARHRGTDHVFFTSGDGGGCDLNRLGATRGSIILSHYLRLNTTSPKCGIRGKDVAVPPDVPGVHDPHFLRLGETAPAARAGTLFFAGNVPDAHLVDSTSDERLGREEYSEGVRQLVWKHHRSRAGFRIVPRSATYLRDWSASKFCLAPLGVGWGVRLTWAVAAGCVPVLAETSVAPWFDDALDYSSFALQGLPKSSLPLLGGMLTSVAAERMSAMHASLMQHRKLLLWRNGGVAYNVTMHELCWRARHRKAGVDCGALLPPEASGLVIPPPQRRRRSKKTLLGGSDAGAAAGGGAVEGAAVADAADRGGAITYRSAGHNAWWHRVRSDASIN